MWLKRNFNLLVIIGVFILIYFLFQKKEDYVKKYNDKINALEQKVDSLHSINNELTFKIDTLNQQISKLDQQIVLKDIQITKLKDEIQTQIDSVDSFTFSELEQFFTKRYEKRLNSTSQSTNR